MKRLFNALNQTEVGGIIKEIAFDTPQGRFYKDVKATQQAFKDRKAGPPPPPPPTELNEKQKEVVGAVANRVLPPAIPARVPSSRPSASTENPLRGTLTTPRPLTSAEIQQRAREGIATQRNILGTPVTPPPAPVEAPATEFTPLQQSVMQKMEEQRKALFPDRFPPATTPAGTRTNKRKSKGGIGSFGMSLINTDLPK